ncbi:hypothetical protein ACROYT_G004806 [Oculina patagonica]
MKLNQFIYILLPFVLQKKHFGVWKAEGQCDSPLGVEDKSIPDSDITASSEYNINHGKNRVRLNTVETGNYQGAWCPRFNIPGEWIQINLRKITKVTRIVTQGRQDYGQWVKTYKVCYGQKLDGFCEPIDQVFVGNTDKNTPVSRTFTKPIYARFVRILPLTWYSRNCMRLELYGCKEGFTPVPGPVCMESLGMETGKIPDSDITASSHYNIYSLPKFSRLNLVAVSSHTYGCWASKASDLNQWLQVKFGQRVEIKRVATQGRHNVDQWVKSYTLNYSSDGLVFEQYQTNKNETVFSGNSDKNTVVSHVLNPPIIAQYVRVLPVTWTRIAMRLDFYGCIPDPPVPAAVYPLNGEFGTRDLSSNENPPGVPYNVQLAPGPFGQPNGSYQFSGNSTNYIEFPNNGGLDTRYSLTLLAWVFFENTDGPIFNYGTDHYAVHFWVGASQLYILFRTRSGTNPGALYGSPLKADAWNFVGASYDYDSGVQKLWAEGKVYDVQNIGTHELDTSSAVRMGFMTADNRNFKGRISCMQVYNTALTEREVHAVRGLCYQKVPLSPVAFFPLNGQYETTDVSHSANLPGQASGVELAPGPDGSVGGSYQFSGNVNSFIKFPNNGGLDTRYSLTFLAWIYHEQTKGPIFYYADPDNGYGVRFILFTQDYVHVRLFSSNLTMMEGINSVALKPKTWHFVGWSYNYVDREIILWINGSFHRKNGIFWPAELATQQSVIMGGIEGGAGTYKGRISCVQLFDRVLTELEIEDAKQSCLTADLKAIVSVTCCLKGKMSKKCKVNWSDVQGASPKPKRLHLKKDEADSLYHCPIQECEHDGFQSQRGCRKHVSTKHSWFFYFDERPDSKQVTKSLTIGRNEDETSETTKHNVKLLSSFPLSCNIGEVFTKWLTGSAGGCKKDRAAQQIVTRCFKFLRFCCEDEEELTFEVIDFSLCSPNLLFKFIDYLQDVCKLGHGGRLGYIDAISELTDFRKLHGASEAVLRKFSTTELYLKRARKTVAKMMRLQWTQDLDIDTLEARGHWATMEELLEVVKFHLPRYENTVKMCKTSPAQVNPSDLTFATKFVAMYLFIKVKGSRPMTYQYLTVDMIATAKENGGFIDQKTFKTAGKYGFDSSILTDANMHVLNGYISNVRPLLKPQCDFVLVTRNGGQHGKLGETMSKLVFDAIGKYIHPTRYRQIVETQSLNQLTSEEQRFLSEDQKHSSVVAKVHYNNNNNTLFTHATPRSASARKVKSKDLEKLH